MRRHLIESRAEIICAWLFLILVGWLLTYDRDLVIDVLSNPRPWLNIALTLLLRL